MSQEGVKKVIARMITDSAFKAAVHSDAKDAIEKSGYSVTDAELKGIAKLKPNDLQVAIKRHGAGPVASYECDVRSAKV